MKEIALNLLHRKDHPFGYIPTLLFLFVCQIMQREAFRKPEQLAGFRDSALLNNKIKKENTLFQIVAERLNANIGNAVVSFHKTAIFQQ